MTMVKELTKYLVLRLLWIAFILFAVIYVTALWTLPAHAAVTPVFSEWVANGSGCRATSVLPGNVHMDSSPQDIKAPYNYRAKFTFSHFFMREMSDIDMKIQRDCSVRVTVTPPPGKKIVGIRAVTRIATAKDTGPGLDLLATLKLGTTTVGKVQKTLDSGARMANHIEVVDLEAGQGSSEPLPQVGCSEPKVIGFDYSWISTRPINHLASHGSMLVNLGKDRSLVIETKLADCQ